jgi:hypothetical protein
MQDSSPRDRIYTAIEALSGLLFMANIILILQSLASNHSFLFYGMAGIGAILAISNFAQIGEVLGHKRRHEEVRDGRYHYDYNAHIVVYGAATNISSLYYFALAILIGINGL